MATTVQPETAELKFTYRAPQREFTPEEVDLLELKASRRALLNLRTLLHGEPMRELLREQMDAADKQWKEWLAASNGAWKEVRLDMSVEGFTATEFVQGMAAMQSQAAGSNGKDDFVITFMYPMHPEHYAVPPQGGVVETLSGMPTRLILVPKQLGDMPDFVQKVADESYPLKQCAEGQLEDGTTVGYLFHQYKDTPTGCDLIFRGFGAAAAPDYSIEEHEEHFAVEFRNAIRNVAARASRSGAA
jgi:hypothetical protein